MIGDHSQKDGGFTILPLTEQRADQLAATVRFNLDEMGEWIAAAEHLTNILSLIAKFGASPMFTAELRQAEARYDAARAAAKLIMSVYLTTPGRG